MFTTYSVSGLIESIVSGEVALPDIQGPFVWQASKVRDLLDSMYKGFPVGYLLFWETGIEPGARQIGGGTKDAVPRLLIVDGQQRLTSLFAVMTGREVMRKITPSAASGRHSDRPTAPSPSPTPPWNAIPSSSQTSRCSGNPTAVDTAPPAATARA
jgi:hypothetical protein